MGGSRRYGLGILGNCCTHGEFVAAALKAEPAAHVVAGWEDDPRRTAGLSTAIGMELASSPEALLDHPAIEIVALACSPHQKAEWAERAARAGKHIFLNKPMAESLHSARRIENAVAGGAVQLVYDIPAIGRFDPVTAKLLDEVRAGRYGRAINYAHSFSFTFSLFAHSCTSRITLLSCSSEVSVLNALSLPPLDSRDRRSASPWSPLRLRSATARLPLDG